QSVRGGTVSESLQLLRCPHADQWLYVRELADQRLYRRRRLRHFSRHRPVPLTGRVLPHSRKGLAIRRERQVCLSGFLVPRLKEIEVQSSLCGIESTVLDDTQRTFILIPRAGHRDWTHALDRWVLDRDRPPVGIPFSSDSRH